MYLRSSQGVNWEIVTLTHTLLKLQNAPLTSTHTVQTYTTSHYRILTM